MIRDDEDALVCDFAEYYGIYNYKGLPLRTVATLAVGLRADSRTIGRIVGVKQQPMVGITLVQILDTINQLAWSISGTKDRPPLALNYYYTQEKEDAGMRTGADYEQARQAILGKLANGRK